VTPPRASELPSKNGVRRVRIECGTLAACEKKASEICAGSYRVVSSTQGASPGTHVDTGQQREPPGGSDPATPNARFEPDAPVPKGEMIVECP